MGTLHTLNFSRTPQVFTPQVCHVLEEANRIVRELRCRGIRALTLSLDGVRHGLPAELTISGNAPRIESNLVHVTHKVGAGLVPAQSTHTH